MTAWTATRDQMLLALWRAGMGTTDIAEELGGFDGMTPPERRTAVLARVNELEAASPASKSRATKPKVTRASRSNLPARLATPAAGSGFEATEATDIVDVIDTEIPIKQRKTLLSLTANSCRWPVGSVDSPDFFFCGGVAEEGKPYCSAHCQRAYQGRARRAMPARASAA